MDAMETGSGAVVSSSLEAERVRTLRPVVQCFRLFKRYVRGQNIFHDASLQVGRGEFVFLTGPSGSGKTTLLNLLMRLDRPNEGHILIDGRNLNRMKPADVVRLRRMIGVVFQDFRLIESRSVASNVALPLEVVGKPRAYIRKKVRYVLRFVEMEKMAKVPCRCLSGGEQQRVALARAVVNDPLLVLADEPTGNLDERASRTVMELLESVHRRGTTIILATHDRRLPEYLEACRVVAIENRAFVECGEAAPGL